MNCKVCGTRLGILERWRYGDFCSQEHKTVFADDLESLDRQLTNDIEPMGKRSAAGKGVAAKPGAKDGKDVKAGPTEPSLASTAASTAIAEPEAEPMPAMADFVRQVDPKAHRPPRLEEKKEPKPAVERAEKPGELWKLLAKRAEQETLPPQARAGAWPQDRPVIVITSQHETTQGPGGYYLTAAYPAQVPAGQMVSYNGQMPRGGLTGVSENFWGPAFAVGMPLVPAQPQHWVDDQGWHWISDPSAQMIPSVENVLASYPMAAPWAQWPMMAPGMAQPQAGGMRQPMGEATMPQMGSGPAGTGSGQQPGGARPGGIPQAGPGRAYPGGQAGPDPGGIPHPGMMPGGLPGVGPVLGGPGMGGGQAVSGGVFGGGQVMAWGGSHPMAMGPLPQGGPGYQWRELPPPFFSALVDLSHGVHPLAQGLVVAIPVVESHAWTDRAPGWPAPEWTLPAELKVGRTESVLTRICPGGIAKPSKCAAAPVEPLAWPCRTPECPAPHWTLWAELAAGRILGVDTRTCHMAIAEPNNSAASAWRAMHTGIPSSPGLPRPRVPRRAAPPVLLPLGGRLGLSRPAEPMMSTGNGATGAKGA